MRILLAGPYLPDPRQGSPKVLLRLGAELRRLGHEVHFLFLDTLPWWAQSYRLAWFLFPLLVAAKVLWAARGGQHYEVIDVSSGDGWLIAILKRWFRHRAVVICRSHGWEHEDYRVRVRGGSASGQWRWMRGLLMRVVRLPMVAISARRSDAIVVGSSPVRAFAVERRWKRSNRICVIPCGIDAEYFSVSRSERGGGLLYVGSWLHGKGVLYLAKAYELVRSQGCDIPLSIIGYGQAIEEVLRSFEPTLWTDIRIRESDRAVDEQRLVEEYRKHDLLVFPSLQEGFGMVFLEAMASGLPVIASPVGGVVDLVRHEENGIIVPLRDAQALGEAIVHLWKSPEKRRRLGEAARETARVYTWDKIAQRTLECYRATAEGTQPFDQA